MWLADVSRILPSCDAVRQQPHAHAYGEKNGISFLRWGTGGLVSNNCRHGVTSDVPDAAER